MDVLVVGVSTLVVLLALRYLVREAVREMFHEERMKAIKEAYDAGLWGSVS